MRTTIFGVTSLSFFIPALTSCGGGQSPSPSPDDATVSLYPSRVVMAPGEALTFTAVPSDGNGSALSWEASQGTLVANGVTANYTAPNTSGNYEVRVIPPTNPAGVATSEITVAMLESETSDTLTSEGGEVAAEDDSILRVGSGVLSRDAEVRLRTYPGVAREPGEGLVGVGPLREFLFPATAFVNVRALPAEAPNGGGAQDEPFDGRILLRAPFPDGLQEDGTYFLKVTIDAGGVS